MHREVEAQEIAKIAETVMQETFEIQAASQVSWDCHVVRLS